MRKTKEANAVYMRKYRAKKKVEAKNLEERFNQIYHENIELKKQLNKKQSLHK